MLYCYTANYCHSHDLSPRGFSEVGKRESMIIDILDTMIIKNITKQTILSKNITFLTTEKEKLKGLIGEKIPKAVIFQTRFGIHTFFMKFPIDILVLDKNRRIAVIKQSLKPNRIFLWNPLFSTVIELPIGTVKETNTHRGDIVFFEQSKK